MRRLTLCFPYYRNAGMLAEQLKSIAAYPAQILDRLEVIIVDDGSPDGDAQGADIGCPLRIYKIEVDVRWNQDAARNIAAHEADTPWLLLTDIDHMVPVETALMAVSSRLESNTVYRFSRETWEPSGERTPYKPHPNSWMMTRGTFLKIGGYDERFAGYYGSDADFRDRVQKHAPVVMLKETLIRVPRDTIPDASTRHYTRKEVGLDDVGMRRVRTERQAIVDWKPINRSFPYRRIFPC